MTVLASRSDARWADVAASELDRTLADHAHCEKKASASALKLIADHPDRPGLVRPLARLAQEESNHFLAVLVELGHRGVALPPDAGDPYARALLALVRSGPARLVDRLLVSALIEARSCERLALLGERLPPGRLRDLYRRLAAAEAGHERLFVELALGCGAPGAVRARLDELAAAEARIVEQLPLEPRIH